jgi:type IV secretory pathway protease TraF
VRSARDLTVTALVVAYPPEPLATWLAEGRYLPRGVPLLKPILALEGQSRSTDAKGATRVGKTRADARSRSGKGCRVIGDGEIFLMNADEPASLDGRYFGPIPIAAIAGLAERCGRPRSID